MKKALLTMMCLVAMMAASTNSKAQQVTITLTPGWSWIGFPGTDTLDLATAFGSFTPMAGDVIKSKSAVSSYISYESYNMWYGTLNTLEPGKGYMYKSNRTEPVFLTFNVSQVVVTTLEPTNITTTSAVVGGTVTINEGNHIFARGVCWGMEPTPTIDGNYQDGDNVAGNQSFTLNNLTPNATYYVRAYVVTDYGLAYGEELSFTAFDINSNVPEGAINGLFSVSDNTQVYFSQGNLQYIGSASTPYWKFAENQWDCLGTTTGQNSSNQNADRDLFGWGTSGWDCGNICYHPWNTNNSSGSSYGPIGANNLTDNYANSDWGVYNPISNGGNQPNQWRTLTKDEYGYVFNTRTTDSGILYAKANVNNVNGVVLLPDDWSTSYYDLNNTNVNNASFSDNTITVSEWSILEQHGAVFLPATGYRFGTSVKNVGNNGYYWSSSFVNSTYAYGLYFHDANLSSQDCSNRTYGRGVRLVHVVE